MLMLSMVLFAACGNKDDDKLTPAVTAEPTKAPEVTPTVEPTAVPTEAVATPTVTPVAIVDPKATIDGTTYKAEGYGFSITLPEKWVILKQEETYDYLNTTMGNVYENGETLQKEMEAQGLSYLFLATNSEIQQNGSTDNFIVQTMPSSILSGLSLESVVGTFASTAKSQYTSMGATCEITEPVKITKDGYDYYTFNVVANIPTGADAAATIDVYQAIMYFEKDGTIMQLAGSAVTKENLEIVEKVFDTIVLD